MATQKSTSVMGKKEVALIKKARRQMRKLRKFALKHDDMATMGFAEKQIEVFDKKLADNKKARDEWIAKNDVKK